MHAPLYRLLFCLLLPPATLPATTPETGATSAAEAWKPPPPPPDNFDWIQLKTGEWLKGEIKGMENDRIQIDSEKLDLHTFDLEDVIYIRSPRSWDVLRSDRTVPTGPLEIDTKTIKVGGLEFPRSEITAFSVRGKSELQHWSGELSAGIIVRAGNTKSSDVTYHAEVTRRAAKTRLAVEYTQNLSTLDAVETANNRRADLTFDLFTSARAFWRVPSIEYLQDRFQNIESRLTLGASVGYDFVQQKNLKWDATLGPAWQMSEFYSVQPGEERTKDTGALVLTTHVEADLTDRISWDFDYRGQLTSKEVGETTHHAESTLEIDLTKKLELDLIFSWDRVSQPKADDAGVVPKPDDFRISLNLGIKL